MRYKIPTPVGVKLPVIKVSEKTLQELNLELNSSSYEILCELSKKGIRKLGIDKYKNTKEYYDRAKMELEIFKELGFVDYILLNWDIMSFCNEEGIPTGFGRGSAGGSLILYLIGVTRVDPIKHGLFFERFVSKSRARKIEHNGEIFLDGSLLADIDNDIAYHRRKEVVDYIERTHKGKTSKILTLNTLSSKLCMKECGKIVGGLNETDVNVISDSIPKHFGKVAKLDSAYEESESFKKHADENKKVFKIARKIQGLIKNTGVHPSGISISYYNQEDIMPLQKTNDGDLVSGYDMNDVAELSVKFDILGLRTLSVVDATCKQLGIDMYSIDPTDDKIYSALSCLQTPQGLFQIEADTNFKVCQDIGPKNIEQLSAVIAIARPGALDFKDQYATYVRTGEFQPLHPLFDEIFGETAGLCLYQESLMQAIVKLGFSLDEAETLRRVVGKKKVDEIKAWKEKISKKVEENNLPKEAGDVVWKIAEDSANYSFNKSHSMAYSYLSAVTTYLKFMHPQEFFLSLLRFAQFEPDSHAEISKISQELGDFNIKLLQPDLNKSDIDFKIEGKNIRYGLNSIKGVSDKVLHSLVEFREGEFANKYEVFIAAKQCGLNIGVLSSLIQAGLLDSFIDDDRCRLVLEAQTFNILTEREKRHFIQLGEKHNYDILNAISDVVKNELIGDDNKKIMAARRFETFKKHYNPYKDIFQLNRKSIRYANWYFEKELLGYSYSYNIRQIFDHQEDFMNSHQVRDAGERSHVSFVGVLADIIRRTSQNGNKYARLELHDEQGIVTGLFMDNNREEKLTNFLNSGNTLPSKGDVVIVKGVNGDGIVFINQINKLDDKIYMKLSQLK